MKEFVEEKFHVGHEESENEVSEMSAMGEMVDNEM